jgi:hypothetical protein
LSQRINEIESDLWALVLPLSRIGAASGNLSHNHHWLMGLATGYSQLLADVETALQLLYGVLHVGVVFNALFDGLERV